MAYEVTYAFADGILPERTILVEEGANLLKALRRNRVPAPHSCRQGTCRKCRVFVAQGADHLSPPNEAEVQVLGPEGLAAGERLACQVTVHGPVWVVHGGKSGNFLQQRVDMADRRD